MADAYADFAALAAAETEGVDFTRTAITPAGATWAAIAVHGGSIEGGSGEVARELSRGGQSMAYYEFAGIKPSGNTSLHITSTNFDEPTGLALVGGVRRCLSLHGYVGTAGRAETALGGLDADLVARVTDALTRAGFLVTTAPSEIAGTNPDNICNKTSASAGVQLEMSRALRDSFFPPGMNTRSGRDSGARTEAFHRYVSALRAAYMGRGLVSMGSANVSRYCLMPAPSADVDLTATVATDALAVGGGHFVALVARYLDGSNSYLARVEFSTAQAVIVTLRKRVSGSESFLTQHTTGLAHAPDRRFVIRFQVAGAALRAKVWPDGDPEPAGWQVETTDPDLTAAGQIGMRSILSSANSNTLPVVASWGDLNGRSSAGVQYFTVQRATNGIVKPHAVGTDVRLAQPTTVAL
ncbi:poly-gamma-glutamate hydrolase family protein [Streptomyces sp. TRM75563]|uniref:poly-gamma-glutamate hydrolase family protein n=1 Tax=Streptomyces sp. TRM75563 TaxID=2817418 RepID=UPI001F619778|nr:poly-gamma-glutamate hydrolase family protein [Streptomyces sp. TRM75563]MCI4045483.1 poly-gamma-glutamate hydrolase family protein [Streptomyces sp. TRM75563]